MADNIARALAIQAKKGLDTETIKSTTTEWLETNGIKTGATAEQVAQIEKNTSDISQLSEEIANLEKQFFTEEWVFTLANGKTMTRTVYTRGV